MKSEKTLKELQQQVQKFCEARDWDQYHNAKELAIGAVTEASELLEHFRFQSQAQVQGKLSQAESREAIGDELADVLFFLLRFAQLYDFDLDDCLAHKIVKNAKKYPVGKFYGKNHKSQVKV
jgi:NTP pyrophosphatase (non-canonical NTP hydrolase)